MIINRKDPPSQIATNIEITFDLRIHGCCIFITWPGTECHGTLRARFSPPCPSPLRWRVRVQRCARWCGSVRGRGSPHVQDSEREPLRGAAWALPPCRPRGDGTRRCARGLQYVQCGVVPMRLGLMCFIMDRKIKVLEKVSTRVPTLCCRARGIPEQRGS